MDEDGRRKQPDWQMYGIYESGKSRRYGLLFSVNGGGFALVAFLATQWSGPGAQLALAWALVVVPLAMVAYTVLTAADIWAFGDKMRAADAREPEHEKVFGQGGRAHLVLLAGLIVAAWLSGIVLVSLPLLRALPG